MKVVKFLGGLGNQMFQYAFYLSLEQNFSNVKADLNGFKKYNLHQGFELENVFDIQLKRISALESWLYDNENRSFILRKMRRVLGTKYAYYPEKQYFGFEPGIYSDSATRYYWGYWQNFNYFNNVEAHLKRQFVFKNGLTGKNAAVLRQIKNQNTISLHVRRGDYLTDPLLGNVCNLPYFTNAIDMMNSIVGNSLYVVFSNDILWCKQNLPLKGCLYVDWNTGRNSYLDMELMSSCKHNIISNSSFSWWAAWLNSHSEKVVISPKQWMGSQELDYSGLILKDWIAL
jgi:hypothetical protein